MKVTVITGSAHKNGASALLVDKFIEGSKVAGHDVFRFDAAFEKVSPCLAYVGTVITSSHLGEVAITIDIIGKI